VDLTEKSPEVDFYRIYRSFTFEVCV